MSKALGCDVDTGDGALLAAEAGAELSGMEFSNAYGIAPAGTSVTKGAFYRYSTFYREDGSVLEGAGGHKPYEKNYLRRGDVLTDSLAMLDDIWSTVRSSLGGVGEDAVRTRQAAAMTAHARWMYNAALARTETRGMAKRLDFPAEDPAQHHRLTTGGLDEVWVRREAHLRTVAVA